MNEQQGFLKEKLGSYQVDPPGEVWDGISQQLGHRGRRRGLILLLSAAASLALAISLGIHYLGQDPLDQLAEAPASAPSIVLPDTPSAERPPAPAAALTVAPSSQPYGKPSAAGKASTTEASAMEVPSRVLARASGHSPAASSRASGLTVPVDIVDDQDPGFIQAEVLSPVFTPLPGVDPAGGDDLSQEEAQQILDELSEPLEEDGPLDFERDVKGDRRWLLGAAMSPLYSFRDAEQAYISAAGDQEHGMLSYAGGVSVSYLARGRLAVETGIFFNKMGINIGNPAIQLFSPRADFAPIEMESMDSYTEITSVTNSVGNIVSNSGEVYVNNYKVSASPQNGPLYYEDQSIRSSGEALRQHLDYLELPFNLRYTVLDRDFKIQLVGGVSTNFLVNNYVTMEGEDGFFPIGYAANVKPVNYSGNAGLGFLYQFSGRFSLSMEPRFRYFLNSVNDATLPSTRPYSFGLYTGLNYFF